MLIVYVIFIFLLSILFVQDWKSRSVHLYLFPCILTCAIYVNTNLIANYKFVVLINLVIVLIQLSTIILYLIIKKYPWRKLTTNYFALGDILFLLILSFCLTTELFLIFNICSILISLFIARAMKLKTIPFAGIQALMLALILMFNVIIK